MDIYIMDISAPCRAVQLTAAALGLKPNYKTVNLQAGDQMKPEFLAINPQHCVPTMVDGDLTIWESRAIGPYLATQYGKDDSLYPKNPKKRALVDRMLYFDMGTLYISYRNYVYPVLWQGAAKDPEKITKLQEALGWLNSYLEGQQYVAGSNITVADHAVVATVATVDKAGVVDLTPYTNVTDWYSRCQKNMPGYAEANEAGANRIGAFVREKLA